MDSRQRIHSAQTLAVPLVRSVCHYEFPILKYKVGKYRLAKDSCISVCECVCATDLAATVPADADATQSAP